MLIYHIEAQIFDTATREFRTVNFTVRANDADEAETKAFDILSEQGIPLAAVCHLVCSVN